MENVLCVEILLGHKIVRPGKCKFNFSSADLNIQKYSVNTEDQGI